MSSPTLTQQEINELEELIESGDRTGYYVRYYELTGSEQTLMQARISSFSGPEGEAVRLANVAIKDVLEGREAGYPEGGLIAFSDEIARSHFSSVKDSLEEGRGGYLTDQEVIDSDARIWDAHGIGEFYPGNALQAHHAMEAGDENDAWAEIGSLASGILQGWQSADLNTAAEVLQQVGEGVSAEDFVGDQYEWRTSQDSNFEYIYDNETNTVVYVGDEHPVLSEEELNELQELVESGDRTGYYIRYYELTGSEQAITQAHISSFSGFEGEIANLANIAVEQISSGEEPGYPEGGVVPFSESISGGHFEAVQRSFADGKGGYLSDEEALQEAANVWDSYGIGEYFPGNIIQAGDELLDGNVQSAWDEIASIGSVASAASAGLSFHPLINFDTEPEDFIGEQYEWRSTSDDSYKFIYDTEQGKVVYVDDKNLLDKASDWFYSIATRSEERNHQPSENSIPVDHPLEDDEDPIHERLIDSQQESTIEHESYENTWPTWGQEDRDLVAEIYDDTFVLELDEKFSLPLEEQEPIRTIEDIEIQKPVETPLVENIDLTPIEPPSAIFPEPVDDTWLDTTIDMDDPHIDDTTPDIDDDLI